MIYIRTMVAAFLLFVCHLTCLFGQELPMAKPRDVGVSPEKVKELSNHMQMLVDRGFFAGGITLMARHGKVVHFETAGAADLDGAPLQKDTIFRMASMTKPITSVAAMILCDDGKLALDDPVHKFIPEFKKPTVLVSVDPLVTKPANAEILVRHLLTHQSGLIYRAAAKELGKLYIEQKVNEGVTRTAISLDENMRRLAKLPLLFSPGEKFQYGLSTDVLGCVVERASRKNLDAFMRERIFEPLGMNDTHFFVPAEKVERLALAYELTDEGLDHIVDGERRIWKHSLPKHTVQYTADYAYRGPRKYLSGGGGLCSTAEDYAHFCQMLLNEGKLFGQRILKPSTVSRV